MARAVVRPAATVGHCRPMAADNGRVFSQFFHSGRLAGICGICASQRSRIRGAGL